MIPELDDFKTNFKGAGGLDLAFTDLKKYNQAFDKQAPITGNSFNFLESLLKNSINNGMPNKGELLQSGIGNINRGTNNAIRRSNESFAGRGMARSGVASAVNAGIANQGNEAIGNYELGLNEMERNYKQNAIMNLLGLNQFEGNQNMDYRRLQQQDRQFNQGLNEQRRQFDEQQEFNWGDFLGALAGIGGRVGAGILTGGGSEMASGFGGFNSGGAFKR